MLATANLPSPVALPLGSGGGNSALGSELTIPLDLYHQHPAEAAAAPPAAEAEADPVMMPVSAALAEAMAASPRSVEVAEEPDALPEEHLTSQAVAISSNLLLPLNQQFTDLLSSLQSTDQPPPEGAASSLANAGALAAQAAASLSSLTTSADPNSPNSVALRQVAAEQASSAVFAVAVAAGSRAKRVAEMSQAYADRLAARYHVLFASAERMLSLAGLMLEALEEGGDAPAAAAAAAAAVAPVPLMVTVNTADVDVPPGASAERAEEETAQAQAQAEAEAEDHHREAVAAPAPASPTCGVEATPSHVTQPHGSEGTQQTAHSGYKNEDDEGSGALEVNSPNKRPSRGEGAPSVLAKRAKVATKRYDS